MAANITVIVAETAINGIEPAAVSIAPVATYIPIIAYDIIIVENIAIDKFLVVMKAMPKAISIRIYAR